MGGWCGRVFSFGWFLSGGKIKKDRRLSYSD